MRGLLKKCRARTWSAIYCFAFIVLVNNHSFCQPTGKPWNEARKTGTPPDDLSAPISGIEILLLAGGVLGAKKIYGWNNKKNAIQNLAKRCS